jgi:hypothetical protein
VNLPTGEDAGHTNTTSITPTSRSAHQARRGPE